MKIPLRSRLKPLFILPALFALVAIGGLPATVHAADQIMQAHPEFRFAAAPKIEHPKAGVVVATWNLTIKAVGGDVAITGSGMAFPFVCSFHPKAGGELTDLQHVMSFSVPDKDAVPAGLTLREGHEITLKVDCTISDLVGENKFGHPGLGAFKVSFDGATCSTNGHPAMTYALADYLGSTSEYVTLAPAGMVQMDTAMTAARSAAN